MAKLLLNKEGKILASNGKIPMVKKESSSGGSGGVIEVDTLPETGEEGCVYSTNFISGAYIYINGTGTVKLSELLGTSVEYEIVDSLPTNNIIVSGETFHFYVLKNYSNAYAYIDTSTYYGISKVIEMILQVQLEYKGATDNINFNEDGIYLLVNNIYYIYKDNTFNQISSNGEITHISNYNNFIETYDVSKYNYININNYAEGNIANSSSGILYYRSYGEGWKTMNSGSSISGGVGNILVFLTLGNNVSITGSNYQILSQDDNLILIRLTDNDATLSIRNS